MFPLSTVLFPYEELPLHVFEARYRAMVVDCLRGDNRFGVVLIDRGSEVGGGDRRLDLGTVATIEQASPLPDGRWALLASGGRRCAVECWLEDDPYPRALVQVLDEGHGVEDPSGAPGGDGPTRSLEVATAAVRRARGLLSELGEMPPLGPGAPPGDHDDERAWRLCAEAPLPAIDRHRLLGADGWRARAALLTELADALALDLSRLLAQGTSELD